jgi:hypothetical protein
MAPLTLDVNLKAHCERRLSAGDWARARRRQARQRRRFAVAPLSTAMLEVDVHYFHRREPGASAMARYLHLSVAVSNAGMKSAP